MDHNTYHHEKQEQVFQNGHAKIDKCLVVLDNGLLVLDNGLLVFGICCFSLQLEVILSYSC